MATFDEDDFQDEIRSHLAIAEQEKVADGADRDAARHAALKDFGNVTLATEAARQVWMPRWLEAVRDAFADVRHAARGLAKAPGFAAVAIAVLALGIGLNAAVFTLFKSLALRPLAGVDGSGSLGVVLATSSGGRHLSVSYPDYEYLRDRSATFAGVAGSRLSARVSLGLESGAEPVAAEFVTGNYFDVLRVPAFLGRTITPADTIATGGAPVVVLGHALWQRAFGGDIGIVGTTIHMNGHPFSVVGVADAAFHGSIVGFDIDAFVPVTMAPVIDREVRAQSADLLRDANVPLLMVLGRLQPGASIEQAAEETALLAGQLARGAPIDRPGERLVVRPIWQSPYGAQTYMLPAVVALGVMGLLLLAIVCANVAGLVLVRGLSRRGELAVRLALGAGRWRVARLLAAENLLLAVPGAIIGLLVAASSLPLLWSSTVPGVPVRLFLDVSTDSFVVGFVAVAACASALVAGLVPALRSARVDPMEAMKGDSSSRHSASRGRLSGLLVVSQVALSLLLLVCAGLVTRSLEAARHADPGFDARTVTSINVDLGPNGYEEVQGRVFYEQLLERVRGDEGAESATLAAAYPLSMVDTGAMPIEVEGHEPPPGEELAFLFNVVAPGYFRTLRIGLVEGRDFDDRDRPPAQPVAIVNETFARRFWGAPAAAIGRRVRGAGGEWRAIVGVARDVKYARINEDPRPYVYLSFDQVYLSSMILHARGAAGASVLIERTRQHLHEMDPHVPVLFAGSLEEQTASGLSLFTMTARALFLFGLTAMALAALGMYGLVAYAVKQRTQEIGIRMAIGADRRLILEHFLARGLRPGGLGAIVGLALSLAVTRLLGSVLYGVSATDALSFAAALTIVLAVTLLATAIPAWQATRTNPIAVLRRQ